MTQQLPIPPDSANAKCMPAELLENPSFLLGRLGVIVKTRAFEQFERDGFSPYHYSVLALLDEGARSTQVEIADALELDRGTLVKLLDGLEARGLVARQRDPNDRRRHVVSLTAGGRAQLTAFRTIATKLNEEFLAPLDEESRAVLLDLLSQLARPLGPPFVREPEPAAAG
jgi:DNA-binding MarR family transcriptional regulator